MPDQSHIRNFSIIAHIDHGKSTLADRILQATDSVVEREMRDQLLDRMDLERERGITIKAQAVRVYYRMEDGQEYQLNLIDTPGHVDFSYEVSRSLAACEGVLLVVDASQGIEAQTLANTYLALDNDLEIIPVLNKIDLPVAEPERRAEELRNLIGCEPEEILHISAKTGEGVDRVLREVVRRVSPPHGSTSGPPRALIFDSIYDQYRGVVAFLRVVDGVFERGDAIRTFASKWRSEVEEVGIFSPDMRPTDGLGTGEVGYLIGGVKNVSDLRVGDTLTNVDRPAEEALPGYKEAVPMVFCGLFPVDGDDYPVMKDALEKLALNDSSLFWEPETSQALGFGFRCGFLGLLHMEIVRERLEREFDLELIATTPNVRYQVQLTSGEMVTVSNPVEFPAAGQIEEVREPYVSAGILVPDEFVGAIMELCQDRRGAYRDMEYLSAARVRLAYDLPLAEIVLDFFDILKSRTKGYASLDYEMKGYEPGDLVKLDILIAGDVVDALSFIVHRDKAYRVGRRMAQRLRGQIPRQMFEVPIQAIIGSKVIARETVRAIRKDVVAKCYGGDVTRKRKLLEKQKAGKKRMKTVGSIDIPQEAFLAVLDLDEE